MDHLHKDSEILSDPLWGCAFMDSGMQISKQNSSWWVVVIFLFSEAYSLLFFVVSGGSRLGYWESAPFLFHIHSEETIYSYCVQEISCLFPSACSWWYQTLSIPWMLHVKWDRDNPFWDVTPKTKGMWSTIYSSSILFLGDEASNIVPCVT